MKCYNRFGNSIKNKNDHIYFPPPIHDSLIKCVGQRVCRSGVQVCKFQKRLEGSNEQGKQIKEAIKPPEVLPLFINSLIPLQPTFNFTFTICQTLIYTSLLIALDLFDYMYMDF